MRLKLGQTCISHIHPPLLSKFDLVIDSDCQKKKSPHSYIIQMPPAEIRETNNRVKKNIYKINVCSNGTEFSMDNFLSFKVDRHFQKDVTIRK